MAIEDNKINEGNFGPGTNGDRFTVYSKQYNQALEEIQTGIDNAGVDTGAGVTTTIKISLTKDDIDSINSTPVVAIPAAGAGKRISILSAIATKEGSAFGAAKLSLVTGSGLYTEYFFVNNFFNQTSTEKQLLFTTGQDGLIPSDKGLKILGSADSVPGTTGSADIYITYITITL